MSQYNTKTFSVVIPLYNKRAHIVDTIESVLAQTFRGFEVIVVDDGSTDGGPNLVEKHFKEQVRLIRQPNAGVSIARNTGTENARGDIIAFLDADDSWEPHYLEELYTLSKKFPEASCFGTAYQFKVGDNSYLDPDFGFKKNQVKDTHFLIEDYFDVVSRGDLPFFTSSFAIKKEVALALGGFPERVAMGEDQDLFCRAAIQGQVAYSTNVLSFYHLDATNRACNNIIPSEECIFSRRAKELASLDENERFSNSLLRYSASHILHIASQNVRIGQYDVARKLLSDKTCARQPARYIWWSLRCLFGKMLGVASLPRI